MFKMSLSCLTFFMIFVLSVFSIPATAIGAETDKVVNSTTLKKWETLSSEQKDFYREKFRKFKNLEDGQKKEFIKPI